MSKKSNMLPAIHRAAYALKAEYPDAEVNRNTASFAGGAIALDFSARLLYCQDLHVIELIAPFTTKQEIMEKIKGLMSRLEMERVAKTNHIANEDSHMG